MSRQALELALEALELHGQQYPHMVKGYCLDAITAIKEALAQPEQEPVAWTEKVGGIGFKEPMPNANYKVAATIAPQRKPLTDEQIMANDVLRYHFALNGGAGPISKQGRKVIDAIEAAHGIKE